jgi:hypothetical protein
LVEEYIIEPVDTSSSDKILGKILSIKRKGAERAMTEIRTSAPEPDFVEEVEGQSKENLQKQKEVRIATRSKTLLLPG